MLSRIRRSVTDKDEGFTLIELLVVIIIIGILAAIAIPVFLNQRKKSVDAALKSDLHNAAVLVETWVLDHPGTAITYDNTDTPDGVLKGIKVSPGSFVAVKESTGTLGGWCLFGINHGGAAMGSPYMAWYSLLGGLGNPILVSSAICD